MKRCPHKRAISNSQMKTDVKIDIALIDTEPLALAEDLDIQVSPPYIGGVQSNIGIHIGGG